MNNSIDAALDILIKKKKVLESERQAAWDKFTFEIEGLEKAINILNNGMSEKEKLTFIPYDDQNPDYIKGSIEEM